MNARFLVTSLPNAAVLRPRLASPASRALTLIQLTCFVFLSALLLIAQEPSRPSSASFSNAVRFQPMKARISFEPNVGQIREDEAASELFVSRTPNYSLVLEANQARMGFSNQALLSAEQAGKAPAASNVTLRFLGADAATHVVGKSMLPSKHNYMPTGDPKTWRTNVPVYGEVEYQGLYRGVDLSFYGNPDRLEYDFHIAPQSNVSQIRLALDGAESVDTDAEGNLVVRLNGRSFRMRKPVTYQQGADGGHDAVDAAYRIERVDGSETNITFDVGRYDHSRALVIDPVVDYAFYLPATVNGYLYVGASTTDPAGNTYIAGTFPNVLRAYGFYQAGFFVAKYNASGEEVYNTTFGTSKFPNFAGSINGITVDSTGKVYLVGEVTGAYGGALPYTSNAYEISAPNPYSNGFLSVVNAAGNALTYSTYFGGTGGGVTQQVAVDPSGDATVIGLATGTLPLTPGAPFTAPIAPNAGFVAKFNPNASGAASLVYSTFLGGTVAQVGYPGSQVDAVNGVATDAAGNAYVTGNTGVGAVYPTTPGAYRYNGRDAINDVFVTKINPTGTAFVYSALLGPGQGNAIKLDGSDNAYVTGTVFEDDYPTTNGAYQTTYPSGFVTELNAQGSALVYSTFLGGPNDLFASGANYVVPTQMALAPGCTSACEAYVAGYTNGSDLPLIDQVQSYVTGSTWSGFYVELAGNGSQALQSSYFASGSGFDPYQAVPGIGVDTAGNIYVTGDVLPLEFPVTQTAPAKSGEGFFAKIGPVSGAKLVVSPSGVTFATQIVDVSTAQQGLAPQTVYLENLGTEATTITGIASSLAGVFTETNNCNEMVPAGGNCALTINFTPSAASTVASPQKGTMTISSSTGGSATVQLAGNAINDRYIVASCGGVTPCAGLNYADTAVGSTSAAQIVTLTNLGNTAVTLSSMTASLPDYTILTNCPGNGFTLARNQTCEVSIQFHPTQAGLRSGSIAIVSPGTTANTINLPASGTGLLSTNPSSIVLLDKTINFGTETVGRTSSVLTVTVFNNGSAPVTIFPPTTATSGDASGKSDYSATTTCNSLLPQQSCTISVAFTPLAAGTRSGTLSVASSASSTALTSSLTGIGVAAKQMLEFSPDALTFPDQVIGFSSAAASVYVINAGPSPVTIDRVLVTGAYRITSTNCPETTLPANTPFSQSPSCSVSVVFSPVSLGLQTGTITVIDTEGRQSAFSLAGTGVAQVSSILLDPDDLYFQTLPVGESSGTQAVNIYNTGNTPLTVTGISTTGDYSASYPYCTPPFILPIGGSCGPLNVTFTPSKVSSSDNGTLTVIGTGGTRTANLTGAGVQATKAVLLTPAGATGINFGTIEVGQAANSYPYSYYVSVLNTGSDPITFTAAPSVSGTDAADFSVPQNGCALAPAVLNAGSSCNVYLQFTPTASGSRKATLTLTDNAATGSGIQTIALAGTATSSTPSYILLPETLTFASQVITTTSAGEELNFINNSGVPVTIASAAFNPAGQFTRVQNYYGDCNEGAVAANGGRCAIGIEFAPTVEGATASTITLKDSTGKTYIANLYGYAAAPGRYIAISPSGLNYGPQPLLSNSGVQTITLTNNSGTPVSLGQAIGENVIVGTSKTGAYKVTSDNCSNLAFRSDYPNNACGINVTLSPTATTSVGAQAGSISIPVTYRDNSKEILTIDLNGTVVADNNSAELSATALTFADEAVNLTPSTGGGDGPQSITLTNKSNLALTVGLLTTANTSATGPFTVYSDGCSHQSVNPGGNCVVQIAFEPRSAGSGLKGSVGFPIAFVNGKTETLTATYTGNALAAKSSIQIVPGSANFGSQVVGQASGGILFNVTNNGNQPIALGNDTLTSVQAGTNFTRNGYGYNQCGAGTLAVGASCPVFVQFSPQTTGTITGTLTIADGAASGGPHAIPLTGVGLPAAQALTVSQKAISFGSQATGTAGSPQAIYLSNQSAATPISGLSYTLGGTNAKDFTLQTNNCGTVLWSNYGTSNCALLVSFTPGASSIGSRAASITIAYTGAPSPVVIGLSGTGTSPAALATPFPTALSYPLQNVGFKSAAQIFSITNNGSANLVISKVVSTDAAEFPLGTDECAGKTLNPRAFCLIAVAFSPTVAGARTGSIQITDNASGSPQTVQVSGTGQWVPEASLSATGIAFGSETEGKTTAAQTITLSNPGTAALSISSITLTGTDPGDFSKTTTCGASLAVNAKCTIIFEFSPKAAGSRTATVDIKDNAYNSSGSTQTISLAGTGVAN
jgi:hypothetical protein